ncbi:MAG: hypothetical protein OXE84_07795 [Rhodobacteraceae bacterium]|nr:hypothetical protein [Paracoccaceae bacterium]MCY4327317.1 hypothetical protein [Paracoccaceae bacterium]
MISPPEQQAARPGVIAALRARLGKRVSGRSGAPEPAESTWQQTRLNLLSHAIRPVSFGGQTCVVGLHWHHQRFNPVAGPTFGVSWREAHAGADDPAFAGLPPLVAIVGLAAEAADHSKFGERGATEGRVAVTVEDSGENLWWAAMLSEGQPLPIAEYLFNDQSGLIAWIESEASEIDRIITVGDFERELNVSKPLLRVDTRDIRPTPDQPEFRRRGGPVAVRMAAGCALLGLLGLLGNYVWSTVERASVTPDVQFVPWEMELETFVRGCESALSGFWPRPPGWEMDQAGCSAAGMQDNSVPQGQIPGIRAEHGIAYHRFRLMAGHNAVLARAAAELLYETWDGTAEIQPEEIVLTQTFSLIMNPVLGRRSQVMTDDLLEEAERRYLGLADVTLSDDGVRLTSQAGLASLIVRMLAIDQHMPLSVRTLRRGREGLEIVIEPRRQTMREASG